MTVAWLRGKIRSERSVACHTEEVHAAASLRELVTPDTLSSLAATDEIPDGDSGAWDPVEVERLLLRFLRAEKLQPVKAAHRLEKHAAWRREFLPGGAIPEEEVRAHFAHDKVLLQPAASPRGLATLVVRARHHLPSETPTSDRFVVFCLEAAAKQCRLQAGSDRVFAIFDLGGLALRNLDAGALRAAFGLLSTHYPERLEACYMYDAPAIFGGLWKLVSPFIDPATRRKIRFVSGPDGQRELREAIGESCLPAEFGGTAQPVPVQQAVALWKGQQAQGETPVCKEPAAAAERCGDDAPAG